MAGRKKKVSVAVKRARNKQLRESRAIKKELASLGNTFSEMAGTSEANSDMKKTLERERFWALGYAKELMEEVGGGKIGAGTLSCIRSAAHAAAWGEELFRQAARRSHDIDKINLQKLLTVCLRCHPEFAPSADNPEPEVPKHIAREDCKHKADFRLGTDPGTANKNVLTMLNMAMKLRDSARQHVVAARQLASAPVLQDPTQRDPLDAFLENIDHPVIANAAPPKAVTSRLGRMDNNVEWKQLNVSVAEANPHLAKDPSDNVEAQDQAEAKDDDSGSDQPDD